MERLKIIIGILLIQTACFSSVSSQDLLNNLLGDDNITWVAETEIFFSLETKESKEKYLSEFQKSGIQTKLETIKISPEIYQQEGFSYANSNNALSELIYKGIRDEDILLENNLAGKMNVSESMIYFSTIDTFVSFDSETYEETLEVAYNDDEIIKGYIGEMIWYYNQKEKNIYSKLISYKLVSDNYIQEKNECSIANNYDVITQRHHYNHHNILWSKATKIEEFDFSTSKILKGKTIPIFKEIFKTNIEDKTYNAYQSWGNISSFKPYSNTEFENLIDVEVDTFISFDPVTYKETITLEKRDALDFNSQLLTSFVHYWYWDEKSHSLSCELISLAIMYEGEDDAKKPYAFDMFKVKAQNNN